MGTTAERPRLARLCVFQAAPIASVVQRAHLPRHLATPCPGWLAPVRGAVGVSALVRSGTGIRWVPLTGSDGSARGLRSMSAHLGSSRPPVRWSDRRDLGLSPDASLLAGDAYLSEVGRCPEDHPVFASCPFRSGSVDPGGCRVFEGGYPLARARCTACQYLNTRRFPPVPDRLPRRPRGAVPRLGRTLMTVVVQWRLRCRPLFRVRSRPAAARPCRFERWGRVGWLSSDKVPQNRVTSKRHSISEWNQIFYIVIRLCSTCNQSYDEHVNNVVNGGEPNGRSPRPRLRCASQRVARSERVESGISAVLYPEADV